MGYPAAVRNFTSLSNGDLSDVSQIDPVYDEITAMEGGLLNGLAHDLKFVDALFDIGKAGATRPRDVFISRNMTVGGSVAVANDLSVAGSTTLGIVSVTGLTTLTNSSLNGVSTFNGAANFNAPANFADTVNIQKAEVHSAPLVPPQITADQNDYTPTGWATSRIVRLSTDADGHHITGFAAGAPGTRRLIWNGGGFNVLFDHESAASAATNRILVPGGVSPFTLRLLASVEMFYDGTRWIVIGV